MTMWNIGVGKKKGILERNIVWAHIRPRLNASPRIDITHSSERHLVMDPDTQRHAVMGPDIQRTFTFYLFIFT